MARAKRKTPGQETRIRGKEIGVPAAQLINDNFRLVDVANHSEEDQRHMVRSAAHLSVKQRATKARTLKRRTKIEKLYDAKVISLDDAKACEWYQATHELAFETAVKTADYERAGRGGGDGAMTLLAQQKAKMEARNDFWYARAGISPMLIHLFEKVVLHGRPLGKLSLSFRLAARQLRERMPHLFEVG